MEQIHTMDDVQKVLERFIPTAKTATSSYKLDRMEKLLDFLGNPQNELKVIHVAGTSGKSSTCYYLAATLSSAGHSVGMTISPHVDSVRERVQLSGKPLSEVAFAKYFSEFFTLLEKSKITPSYFECIIAFAYWVFAREQVDYAVIEVGLGGRLDATNTVSRTDKVCVITEIGLDHTEILGDTLDKIAYEKAGIIQQRNSVFMYEQAPEIMTVVDDVVAEKQADLELVILPSHDELPSHLPLFQQRNWYIALYIVEKLLNKPLAQGQREAVAAISIPARMEHVSVGDKTIIIDASHNGQKMNALVTGLSNEFPDQEFAVLAAFSAADNPRAFEAIEELLPVADSIILTSFSGKQDAPKTAINPNILFDHVKTKGFSQVEVVMDPAKAYAKLLKKESPVLLITGSFYLMNHIRPLIKELQ